MFNKKSLAVAERICRMDPQKADELVKDKPRLKAYLEMHRRTQRQNRPSKQPASPPSRSAEPSSSPTMQPPLNNATQAPTKPKALKE